MEEAGKCVGNDTIPSQEATARPSQNKPQQLRIQTFKLANLARDSVSSASQFTSSSTRPSVSLLRREEPVKPVLEARGGLLADVQRTLAAGTTGVKFEDREVEKERSRERGAKGTGVSGWDGAVSQQKGSGTGNLGPESDRGGYDTDTDMELRPGYDRLSLGSLASHGSDRYDHLRSMEPTEVKGQINEARSDDSDRSYPKESGRGLEEEQEEDVEDMGQRYVCKAQCIYTQKSNARING